MPRGAPGSVCDHACSDARSDAWVGECFDACSDERCDAEGCDAEGCDDEGWKECGPELF